MQKKPSAYFEAGKLKHAIKFAQSYLDKYYETWDKPLKASVLAQRLRNYMPYEVTPQEFIEELIQKLLIMEIISHEGTSYLYPKKCFNLNKDTLLSNLIEEIEIKREQANEARSRKLKARYASGF